jgi:hypothetical protein
MAEDRYKMKSVRKHTFLILGKKFGDILRQKTIKNVLFCKTLAKSVD